MKTKLEDDMRTELAGVRVKANQLEDSLRESRMLLSKRESRLHELSRQLDAHRQEHARQAATIITLRQRLQVSRNFKFDVTT